METSSLGARGPLPKLPARSQTKPWRDHTIDALDLSETKLPVQKLESGKLALWLDLAQAKAVDTIPKPKDYGPVTLLVGTSTAGKTSIITEMKKSAEEFFETGVDIAQAVVVTGFLEKHSPTHYSLLSQHLQGTDDIQTKNNVLDAVFLKNINWGKIASPPATDRTVAEAKILEIASRVREDDDSWYLGLSKQEQADFDESVPSRIDTTMWNEGLDAAKKGEKVLFDVLNINRIAAHQLLTHKDVPQRIALVYCPFSVLATRMASRNKEAEESGDVGNKREGLFPFHQFAELYGPKESGEKSLEVISRDFAIQTFNENYKLPPYLEEMVGLSPKERVCCKSPIS